MKRPSSQPGPTRRHLTPKEKAEILKEQRRSGLSLLAFARRERLCYASLLRWRSRPRKAAKAPVACALAADPGFIPVKIDGEVWGGDYVLSWATGRSLRIPRQFETDSLRRLLSVLEALR